MIAKFYRIASIVLYTFSAVVLMMASLNVEGHVFDLLILGSVMLITANTFAILVELYTLKVEKRTKWLARH